MKKWLKRFKEDFDNKLLDIHWKQWSALGVASHKSPESYWIIDLEALIVSTLAMGIKDKRLMSVCIEWLIKNGEWLNTSRFKRITNVFMKQLFRTKETLLSPKVIVLLSDTMRKFSGSSAMKKKSKHYDSYAQVHSEYERLFKEFKIRNIAQKLNMLQSPVLLQLLLRGYYGMDARPDIFIYLLFNKQDNSLSIARNIYYNQKNVYNILGKWCKTGLVTKAHTNYILRKSIGWRDFWSYGKKQGYLNWVKTFHLFDRLSKAFSTPPWCEDMYLMSSFFRDLFDEADEISNALNIQISDPRSYKGAMYYDAFMLGIIEVLKQLEDVGSDLSEKRRTGVSEYR